jgi:hypothetical protein
MDQHQSYRDTNPVVDAEFLVQTARVHPHGFRCTTDLDGNLRVGVAQADETGDSDLLRGQPKVAADGFPFLRTEEVGQGMIAFGLSTLHWMPTSIVSERRAAPYSVKRRLTHRIHALLTEKVDFSATMAPGSRLRGRPELGADEYRGR